MAETEPPAGEPQRFVFVRMLTLLLLLTGPPDQARAQGCDLEPSREGRVARVIDAETVALEDGDTVRLAGALAPSAPIWWSGEAPWRAEARTRAALERIVMGKAVRLAFRGRERDRHRRLLAQMFLAEGEGEPWVQGRLVDAGLARSYSMPGTTGCVRALQRREAAARKRRAGLWRDPFYKVMQAEETEALLKRRYSYAIVEGKVFSVAALRKWTFLNFGEDYREDFTVAIAAGDRRGFAPEMELEGLEGRRVRVRGWVERWNGPVIKASHPEQIEVLDEGPGAMPGEVAGSAPDPK